MEVEVGKAVAPETPASCMAAYAIENVSALMIMGGIESIDARKYAAGFGSRLHVSIAPFADAPSEVTEQGIIMKDAIAQILSVANVARVVLKPDDKDLADMKKIWRTKVGEAKAANGGSAQDFSQDSAQDVAPGASNGKETA